MFGLALTVQVRDPAGDGNVSRDLIVRSTESQTTADVALKLAQFLSLPAADSEGRPIPYGLLVKRTKARLDPKLPLAECDVREGDTLTVLSPIRVNKPNAVSYRPRPPAFRARGEGEPSG